MKLYYRISDNSYIKSKLPLTNKKTCFNNLVNCFKEEQLIVVADTCQEETINWLKNNLKGKNCLLLQTQFGNAGSFRYALADACATCKDEEIIYMIEDDYMHNTHSSLPVIIEEGLSILDYVTLYDHPDKYESEYDYGETCRLFKTNSTHWKTSISTTMTVAAKAATFKKDLKVWLSHTEGSHPNDHLIYSELNQQGRKLGVTIPGNAYHTDLTYFETKGKIDIPTWLQTMLLKDFSLKYPGLLSQEHDFGKLICETKEPLKKLMYIEAYGILNSTQRKNETKT